MSFQNGLPSDQQHDTETGEVREPISTRAQRNIQPRRQWDRLEGLVIRSQAEAEQSQYELAFLAAQLEIVPVLEADAKAQITKERSYHYATLGQLLSHVRPILHKNGFTFKQGTGRIHKQGLDGGNMLYLPVYTKLTYVGTGESEVFVMEMPLPKVDPQAIGSACTYAKRYLLLSALGIATADDDAISAMTQRTMNKDDEADMAAGIVEKINDCKTVAELHRWHAANKQAISGLSEEIYQKCARAYKDRIGELQEDKPEGGKTKK
jgi:ERF superfamily protein